MKVDDELDVIEKQMRAAGYRWTSQRRLIARAALGSHHHFSAEELLDMCRREDEGVSRATVYRTLTMMEKAGFVEGLDTGDGGRKFEHVLGHQHHDHMVCTGCGMIIEFVDEELEHRQEVAASQHGFTITSHSLKMFGQCRDCRPTGADDTGGGGKTSGGTGRSGKASSETGGGDKSGGDTGRQGNRRRRHRAQ
ncbi:MAG: Fur family transcriptional regulator [Planctomycetota bacterium]|jgi:Fur family ferric uptake transcriptional regulator